MTHPYIGWWWDGCGAHPRYKGGMANQGKYQLDALILDRLYKVIMSRRGADPSTSNTARLFAKGTEKIAQKLGEEAVETVIEGIRGKKKELAAESADLLYHLLVLWADRGLRPEQVWETLAEREGISGLVEKSARKNGH